MDQTQTIASRKIRNILGPRFTALTVLCHGIFIVGITLADQLMRHRFKLNSLSVDISLIIGLTLVYLSALLSRRKRTAWIATSLAYAFYLGSNLEGLSDYIDARHHLHVVIIFRAIVLPLAILPLLFFNRKAYVVRSDAQGFRSAIVLSLIILAATFIYGTVGFYTLGRSGFHHQLSVPAAMHYTVDQLNLTTNQPIKAYNNRAKLFSDSLSVVSIAAVLYVLISFFQPLRSRFSNQTVPRQQFAALLTEQHDAVSEDYFKLWPHDKQYFFDSTGASGLAFHVHRGAALILGGPTGKQARYKQLLSEFQYVCWGNDWKPAIIHADETQKETYEEVGYEVQKLGEEAVVGLDKFLGATVSDKYFRNIMNRFDKQGYSFELLTPPHHPALIERLKQVSGDWLERGNHVERGFAMGFYTDSYISICQVAVARDAAGTIQAFLNLVPATFDKDEATYDLLRSTKGALGNVNDFLLVNLAKHLKQADYNRLNLGLCPLVGLEGEESKGLIGSVLRFAYANGDRFYSFSGLYRFKNKYEPDWRPRYIAYQGGVRGFSKTMNALMRTMSNSPKSHIYSKL